MTTKSSRALQLQVVETVLKWLQTEGKSSWIKGDYARDSYGYIIDWSAPSACNFCVVGKIRRTSADVAFQNGQDWYDGLEIRKEIIDKLNKLVPKNNIYNYNDSPSTKLADMIILMQQLVESYKPKKKVPNLADNTDTTTEE